MPVRGHDPDAFAAIGRAGRLAALTLDMIGGEIREGVSTDRLDRLCHDFIRDHGGTAAPLGYRGYPRATCISLNEVVCHGIPGGRRLRDGDVLNIDVTVKLEGWFGDTSRMFFVGTPPAAVSRLCRVAFEALWRGIAAAGEGRRLGDIGHAIQSHAEAHGCSVVREYCGHGIGRSFHQPPTVLNFGRPGSGLRLEPGMAFTIEPMLNLGAAPVRVLPDGWTVTTQDGLPSAQFEHTLGITPDGVEVLTRSPAGLHHPPW